MIMLDLDHELNNDFKVARPDSKLFDEMKQARLLALKEGIRTNTAAPGIRNRPGYKLHSMKVGFNRLIPEKIAV